MIKHTRVKSLTLFMALCLAAVYTASCGAASETVVTDSDTTVGTETAADTADPNDRSSVSDDLPERDFEGRDFIILTEDYQVQDIYTESANGEVVNDAVYERNRTVSERFNVNIGQINYDFNETPKYAQRTVLAGDDAYQLGVNHVVAISGVVTEGIFMNWYDLPYIDFSQPWWADSTVEDLTYGDDKAFLAVGDLALSALYKTYCYFYDKEAAEKYGIGNLYEIVDNGEWTLDKVTELTKDIYEDLNGNSERDEDDYYGMTQDVRSGLDAYLWALGGSIMERDANGIPTLSIKSEHMTDIYDKLYSFLYESEGVCTERNFEGYTAQEQGHYSARESFAAGMTLFANGYLDMAVTHFRFNDSDYGILPYPKFDQNQEEYLTMAGGSHAVLSVPMTVTDTEFVGIITEALNTESYKQVVPAYYEVALKVKYARDDDSVRMLDLIMDSRVFDFGYVYDNWKGMSFYPERLLGEQKSRDFESYYAANSAAAIEHYNDVLEFYAGLE